MSFNKTIIAWYEENKRDLPWRKTTDPYLIWLSEIMLQQTKVAQGLPYYERFVKAFPSIKDLAIADEEKVLKLWQGLGYYSRARNLHHTAQYINTELNGSFPKTYNKLLKLKGVGEYTAAAIASFSYNECVPVVDGNVYRVLARYFDIETNIASSTAKKEFTELAKELIPDDKPALFNQAIMEFGALQCVPKNPNCTICPLNSSCLAIAKKKVDQLPVKIKNVKITERYLNYLLIIDQSNKTILFKRTQKGIWHNLYEFPVIESQKNDSVSSIYTLIHQMYPTANTIQLIEHESVIHKLSHQHLHINFWKVFIPSKLKDGITYKELQSFPVPIVIHNFIERNSF